jgi:hypothetical protein
VITIKSRRPSLKPTTLYRDYAFAWTISGLNVIRARSRAEAREKFDRMSRATMLNRGGWTFHIVAVRSPGEEID